MVKQVEEKGRNIPDSDTINSGGTVLYKPVNATVKPRRTRLRNNRDVNALGLTALRIWKGRLVPFPFRTLAAANGQGAHIVAWQSA